MLQLQSSSDRLSELPTRAAQLDKTTSIQCNNENAQHCNLSHCGTKRFQGCSSWCLDEMNGNPTFIHISCFVRGCHTATDPVVTSLPNRRLHATNCTDSIVVGGSYTFTVNLTLLRTVGLVFNQFSTGAALIKRSECPSRPFLYPLRLKVKFDDFIVWAHTFWQVHTLRPILEVPSNVQTVSLISQRRYYPVNRNPEEDCFVGEWLKPVLTQRAPLLQSCYRHCLPSRSGALHLQCFFPVCPGVCAESGISNTFIHVEGERQVCPQCNITGCLSDQPLTRSIKATTNSSVSFHLDTLRLHGYHFVVFRANLVVDRSDVKNFCSSPVIFHILLDNSEVQQRTVEQENLDEVRSGTRTRGSETQEPSTEREMIVVVSGADRLTLQATTTSKPECNLTVKWSNSRLVGSLPPPTFTLCNKTCADELGRGRLYLSCFLGVCDGTVARTSNLPFFTLAQHHDSSRGLGLGLGIGANRPGSWEQGTGPIQLTDLEGQITTFLFGIGAHPDSSVVFDLDAFRSHGYKFNFFVSDVGIDSGSGCNSNQLASVIFRVYSDGVRVRNRETHNIRTAKTIMYDVSNTGRLTLATRVGFKDACHHAVWAGAELTTVRFPKPISRKTTDG